MKTILNILGVISIGGASFVASSATSGLLPFDVAKTLPPSHHQSLHEQAVGDNPFISKNTSFPKNTNIGTIYQTYNGTIYVSALHGLYQSTDGNTFTKNTSFPKNTNIGTIYQTYNGTIYASTLHDLYQSTDGNTFTKNTSFPTDAVVDKIFQAANGTIYVGLDLGLYQSTDGTTFTKNTSFPATTSIDSIFQAANGTIYVGTDAVGLYQSTNGTTFTKNPSLSSLPKYTSIDTINQSTNGTIYILTNYVSASKDSSVLYQSTDGTTFTKNTSVTSSGSSYLTTIFQAKNGTIYVCPCGGLWQSTDGTTFTKNTSFPAYNTSIATILQTQNGNIYVGTVGNQSGLWQSTDGTTFTKNTSVTSLTISIAVYTIVQTQNGTIYVGTDAAGLYQFSSDLFYNLDFTNDYLNSDGYNVFATERSITLKDQYLQKATLNGNFVLLPYAEQIPVGPNKITMKVKDAYKQDAYEAGLADQNGFINLKIWITGFGYVKLQKGLKHKTFFNNNNCYFAFNDTAIFTFDTSQVTGAKINGKTVDVNKEQKIVIKNPLKAQLDTITLTIKNYTKPLNVYFIDNYKVGIDQLTFHKLNFKDSRGLQEYALDLYINGAQAENLSNAITENQPAYSLPVLKVLTSKDYMLNNPWKNILSNDPNYNLENAINNYGKTISSKIQKPLYNALTVGDASILNYDDSTGGGQYDRYHANLCDNIDDKNKVGLFNTGGVILKFIVSSDGGVWYINNFDYHKWSDAYNNIVYSQQKGAIS